MEIIENRFDSFEISTDKNRMDIKAIHEFLSKHAGWCDNVPEQIVEKSIQNSLCFGLFYKKQQIGFARVISDYATIAYIGDVYILENFRGKGLSRKLMDQIFAHPQLQGLRRWILLTSTAKWLYSKYGFTSLENPALYMELHQPNIYK